MGYEVKQGEVRINSFASSALTEQSKADLFRGLYWDMAFSRRDIAELLNLSPWGVSYYFEKYEIPSRTRVDALKLAFSQGKIRRHYGRGEEHFNWRGGRTINAEGYVFILCRGHPRANKYGYVREHILVWEKTHGMPLPHGWVIHHLNGIPSDNRPENLLALTSRKHKAVLRAKAQRIWILELNLAKAEREIAFLRQPMLAGQFTFSLN